MMPTYSKDQILAALHSTFIADSETLKVTTEYLFQASKKQGFCMAMMQIVDEVNLSVEIKQAALIQLKNTLRRRWINQRQEIDNSQKQSIRGALIFAIMRCHRNYKLLKLYKEVFTIITKYDYKIWLPVRQIVDLLHQDRDTTTLLHMLLAIADVFQFSYCEEGSSYFFQFLKIVFPALQNLLERRPQLQLIYLCIKFLSKAVHRQLTQEIKQITCGWMSLLTTIVGAKNPNYDQHPQDFQTRETEEFYYFHSKKWATRILLRFIKNHAAVKSYYKKQDNKIFSEYWYTNYGVNLVNALIGQFSIPTSKKVRFYQLKCLQTLIGQKPAVVKHFAEIFQYQILLHYLRLQPDDKQLALRQPVQFIHGEEQTPMSFSTLKSVATDVWIEFAQLGSLVDRKTKSNQPGMFLLANMNYLQSKLEDRTNFIEKQLAMYLIRRLSSVIKKYKQIRSKFPELFAKYILPEFTSQCMFLRARALDIFSAFSSQKYDDNLVRQTLEGIYICLTKDAIPLVRIKAAIAFNYILQYQIAKDLVRPILGDILTVYLQLLEKYDLQNITKSLQSIVYNFTDEIGPFSVGLVKHVTIIFFKFFSKDASKSDEQEFVSEAEMAAVSCLQTIKRILQAPIQPDCVTNIEADVVSIIEFIFYKQESEFTQLALDILNAFIAKVPIVSKRIWFFYKVVVYNMVGIRREMWLQIQKLKMPLKHKYIMITIRSVQNIDMIETSTPVLRNYIQKSSVNPQPDHETVKSNIIQLLFYLISQIYKHPLCNLNGEIRLECCTNLLICLLESYQQTLPTQVYIHIYEFIKNNITEFTGQMLKVQTSQLIGLLLWVAPTLALNLAYRDGLLCIFLKQFVSYHSKYKNKLSRTRVILGINSLLLLPQKPPVIMQYIPQLFKTAIILVQKNAQQRIQDNQNQIQDIQIEQFDLDEEDIQQEEQNDKYNSALCLIDQILQFKITMERLARDEPQMYCELLTTAQIRDWPVFLYKVRKALQKVEQMIS